jgi:hypothetical protein
VITIAIWEDPGSACVINKVSKSKREVFQNWHEVPVPEDPQRIGRADWRDEDREPNFLSCDVVFGQIQALPGSQNKNKRENEQ